MGPGRAAAALGAARVSVRTSRVLARVSGRAEAPFDRLLDPLAADLLAGGPLSRERFESTLRDRDALRRLADAKRRPLPAALARELGDYHRRLGASAASLANLDRLARGETVAAIAGQQPAPLGGPLYALHKTASAIGLARAASEWIGGACVPLYWMHGEDSDFAEIRGATVADAALELHDLALPAEAHRDGGLVGDLALEPLAALEAEALALWSGLHGHAEAAALLGQARRSARDLGEAVSALMLALFADAGLVVIDPRLPAFRDAARGVIDRYLADSDRIEAAARAAGARLEALGGRRALSDASLESFVFEVASGGRHKCLAREARGRADAITLSPSVALRPAVQDGVLPTVLMACGPGEIAYLMQLREVFEAVAVAPALVAPRFGATWLPPAAIELLAASNAEPWPLVCATDQVLHALAERQIPDPLAQELASSRQEAEAALARLAGAAREFDASLPQLIESARGKVDFQFARLAEGIVSKARNRLDREHPLWRRLRYVLLPGDKLQERRIASLEPVVRRGAGAAAMLADLAAEHAEGLAAGVHEHYLLES